MTTFRRYTTTTTRRRRRRTRAVMAAAAILSALPSRQALVTLRHSSYVSSAQTAMTMNHPRSPLLNMAPNRSSSGTPPKSSSSSSLPLLKQEPGFEFGAASRQPRQPLDLVLAASDGHSSCLEDRHEFELNLGRAVDTLKQDYPDILTDPPDFNIYHPNLEIIDPSGVKLHGLKNYKNAFRLVHTIVNVFYCPERSILTFRLVYDWARNDIRVSWNAEVVPKAIFGGTKTTLHVDGISVYKLDLNDGKIVQHRVEHLMINDRPIAPERGIIHALQKQADNPDCTIPVFNVEGYPMNGHDPVVEFQSSNPLQCLLPGKSTSLFSAPSAMAGSNDNDASQYPELDWDAFERKNKSRKKFGLKPLTPEEFLELEAKVQQMDVQRRRQQQQQTAAETTTNTRKEPNVFEKLLGNVLQDTCESNFDCQRPEVCCDFGFKKMCCASGAFVGQSRYGEQATVPVVEGPYPPGLGPQDDPRRY